MRCKSMYKLINMLNYLGKKKEGRRGRRKGRWEGRKEGGKGGRG